MADAAVAGAAVFAAMLAAALLLAACDMQVRAGRQIPLSALDGRLVVGQSTEADVAAVLSPPFGRGRAMFPFHDAPRGSWTYYYESGDMSDDRRTFLWVFFDHGVYDGHIWFSSLANPQGVSGESGPGLTVWGRKEGGMSTRRALPKSLVLGFLLAARTTCGQAQKVPMEGGR